MIKFLHGKHLGLLCFLLAVLTFAEVGSAALVSDNVKGFAPNQCTAREGFADMVESVYDSVVNVFTTQKIKGYDQNRYSEDMVDPFEQFRKFFGIPGPQDQQREREAVSLGSGFVISEDGYIVTNNHVIQDATEIVVRFNDGTTANAEIVGKDSKTDIAVLRVKVKKKLCYVSFGDSDSVRLGEFVIAIGNPFGFGGSVSMGVLSARARRINAGPFDDFLQTDTAINRGNSGGPLFNIAGQVIGINTAIYSPSGSGASVGVGFAIPSNIAASVTEQLVKDGKVIRGWLGVKVQDLTDEMVNYYRLKDKTGAVVAEIVPNSPAKKAGIEVGDVLLKFGNDNIKNVDALPRLVAQTNPGSTVPLVLLRKNKKVTINVCIANSEDYDKHTSVDSPSTNDNDSSSEGRLVDGVVFYDIGELNDAIINGYGINTRNGVFVGSVAKGSGAYKAGLRKGHVILSVNQKKIKNLKEFAEQLKSAYKEDNSVLLLVSLKGQAMFLALPAKSDERKQ